MITAVRPKHGLRLQCGIVDEMPKFEASIPCLSGTDLPRSMNAFAADSISLSERLAATEVEVNLNSLRHGLTVVAGMYRSSAPSYRNPRGKVVG